MIKRFVVLLIVIISMIQNGCSWGGGLPEAKITVKVIDEDGKPVEGAKVGIGFERNTGGGAKEIPVEGYTNSDGLFSGSERGNNYVGYTVSREGYYKSIGSYRFKENNGRWEPWNPEVKVILRRIINPVPMYARNTKMSPIEIPVAGRPIGFDLIEYDWVSPYGKGIHSDFVFKLDKVFIDNDNFESTLAVTFTNKFDGIQTIKENLRYGSTLKLLRSAPPINYKQKLVHSRKAISGKSTQSDFEEDNNYIFRIRSEEKDGKFLRGLHGKIYGDIEFDPRGSKTANLFFRFFLNPDYSTNLEFDSQRNLFTNLKSTERIGLE